MRATVKLPKLSDAGDEAVVMQLLVAPGQHVEAGEALMLVETAKAQVEVPSPVAGLIQQLLVSIDDEVTQGQPIAVVDVSTP